VAAADGAPAPEEEVAAADAPAGDDDEDAGEDVHPAINAPKVIKAAAASGFRVGVIIRRSVISAVPLSATSATSRSDIQAGIPSPTPKTPPHRLWLARDYVSSVTRMREP
jgi:hypothetical protein